MQVGESSESIVYEVRMTIYRYHDCAGPSGSMRKAMVYTSLEEAQKFIEKLKFYDRVYVKTGERSRGYREVVDILVGAGFIEAVHGIFKVTTCVQKVASGIAVVR